MTTSLLHALLDHAHRRPDAPALTWLDDGERPRMTWSYRALARRVAGAAEAVRAVAQPGDRVMQVAPQGPEQVVGLLGAVLAGVIPVPLHLPGGPRAADAAAKVRGVAREVSPVALLTVAEAEAEARAPLREGPFAAIPAIDLASLPIAEALPDPPAVADEQPAWLQYTSGSTGDPKGVVVAHGPLIRNLQGFDRGFAHDPDGVVLTWLPGEHDLGLVYGVMLPLWKGMHAVRFAPEDFVRRPARWMQAASRWRATHTASPDFGFTLAAARTTPEEVAGLDLSGLRVLLNGAEPIREASEAAFVDRFAPAGLDPEAVRHAWGMSEAVAVMSKEDVGTPRTFRRVDPVSRRHGQLVDAADGEPVAGNGVSIVGLRIAAVDPDTHAICAPDALGELWLHGDTIGLGYWNRPAATAETFGARTADGDGPWMRTGDLGAVSADGVVYLTGRLKDVIVVRGANHHAEDLEVAVEAAHRALRPGGTACVPWSVGGEERVAVVSEVRPDGLEGPAVVDAVRDALTQQHGVAPARVVLVAPRGVPRTSSGKRRRRETAARLVDGALPVLHDWSAPVGSASPEPAGADVRRLLTARIGAALGLPPDAVPGDTPLRDLGLDSLQLTELAEALSVALGREVPTTLLFEHPTVDALVAALSPADDDALLAALRAELDALD